MKVGNIITKIICFFILVFSFSFSTFSQKQILPNRILSIAGYQSGNIPLIVLKESKKIQIRPPYIFISADMYFGDTTGTRCVGVRTLKANVFDDAILGGLQTINATSLIIFSNIKVKDKSGQVFNVEDIFYRISQN